MEIISHRGLWKDPSEKNSKLALIRSLQLGFGVETDIRDLRGNLVIAHDPPEGGELALFEFLQIYSQLESGLPLALNIKADGLGAKLLELLERFEIKNYFAFDMSIPETRKYISNGISFFSRLSEIETSPAFFSEAEGVWLDCFESEWVDAPTLHSLLERRMRVCMVSPELHNRRHADFWLWLRDLPFSNNSRLMLCTDLPIEASEFFNIKPQVAMK